MQQGCGLKLKDLTMKRACLAAYPLHDHLALTLLQQKWLRLCALPHKQPEEQIKVGGRGESLRFWRVDNASLCALEQPRVCVCVRCVCWVVLGIIVMCCLQHHHHHLLHHRHGQDYFGEKIGLYFVWLGHYTHWLTYAALIGWAVWASVAADGNDPDAPAIP